MSPLGETLPSTPPQSLAWPPRGVVAQMGTCRGFQWWLGICS